MSKDIGGVKGLHAWHKTYFTQPKWWGLVSKTTLTCTYLRTLWGQICALTSILLFQLSNSRVKILLPVYITVFVNRHVMCFFRSERGEHFWNGGNITVEEVRKYLEKWITSDWSNHWNAELRSALFEALSLKLLSEMHWSPEILHSSQNQTNIESVGFCRCFLSAP